MKHSDARQLVLDVVREVAQGRPIDSGTEFSRVGVGPWQRQRLFGPLRDAFGRRPGLGCLLTEAGSGERESRNGGRFR